MEHDADQVIAAAFDEAEARDRQHRRCWVVLVDGAEHQRELIHAEAVRRGVTVHVLLDIVHVIDKLCAASRCFCTATDPAANDLGRGGRPLPGEQRCPLPVRQGLEAGWPIAGGSVEGAARHLVADLLDITCSRWSVPGAEAVLTLRF